MPLGFLAGARDNPISLKPRPALLSRYEIEPTSLPAIPGAWSEQWAQHFGRNAPMAVELGFGGGEYLAWWASENPQWNVVGIEKPAECVIRAALFLEERVCRHARLVRGDARFLLRELFAPGSVQRIWMQFPMPWPKERHAKHRVLGRAFANTLAQVLSADGTFTLVTDQEWYAHDMQGALRLQTALDCQEIETNPLRPFRTRYERKWLAQGRSIFQLRATRRATSEQSARLCLSQPMQHFHLEVMPNLDQVQDLVGQTYRQGDLVGAIKECFGNQSSILIRVVAADGSFAQHFYVRVAQRAEAKALLKIEDHPRPYWTRGVRFLLQRVAESLGVPTGKVEEA